MKISKELEAIFKKYGGNPKEDLWDCHGQLIAKHSWLERVAAKAGIAFDRPAVIESSGENKLATICVIGTLGERTEWSFGEASPHNYKTSPKMAAYPWAMAEKRGKDRVILKLLDLHGEVYSEEEAENFKTQNQKSAYQSRKDGDYEKLIEEMKSVTSSDALRNWGVARKDEIQRMPDNWQAHFREAFEERMDELKGQQI